MTLKKISSISIIGTKIYFTKNKRLDMHFVHPEKIDAFELLNKVAISKGYDIVNLKDVLKVYPESGRSAKYETGTVMVIKPGKLASEFLVETDDVSWTTENDYLNSNKGQLESGDILLLSAAHKEGYIGKNTSIFINITEDKTKAMHIGELIRLRPDIDKMNPYYLLAYLNIHFMKTLLMHSVRGQTVHLYSNDIKNLPVILPPRDVQDSIGEKLEKSIRKKIEAKKNKKDIDDIFTKYLPNVSNEKRLSFIYGRKESQTLNRMDPTIFSPFVKNIFSKLKEKPHFYQNINEGFNFYRGKTPPEKEYTNDGIVVIKVGSIDETGLLHLKKMKSCLPLNKAITEFKNAFVSFGDIIFVATGKGSIGHSTIYLDNQKCIISGELVASRYTGTNFENFVVAVFFMSDIGKKLLDVLAIGPTGQTHLYPKALKLVPIPKISISEKAKLRTSFITKQNSEQLSRTMRNEALSELGQLLSLNGGKS